MTTSTMTDFFADLSRRGHEPMLRRLTATVRFDIVDGDRTEHRLITIDHGDIRVDESDQPADCVITAARAVCDDVVSGRTSALAALLRGAVSVQGDPELMVLTQRLFPRPQPATAGESRSSAESSSP
jgi:putative sterol carrier protein